MKKPVIHPTAFVAPNATLRGDISLAADSSVFYGAVLRGDTASITIGEGSNIQDNCVVHVDPGLPVTVGKNVTVGHGAILHGCTVGDETLIGMGAILLDNAVIPSGCIIAAGALVLSNAQLEPDSLYAGVPAKRIRAVTPEQREEIVLRTARDYMHYASWFRDGAAEGEPEK